MLRENCSRSQRKLSYETASKVRILNFPRFRYHSLSCVGPLQSHQSQCPSAKARVVPPWWRIGIGFHHEDLVCQTAQQASQSCPFCFFCEQIRKKTKQFARYLSRQNFPPLSRLLICVFLPSVFYAFRLIDCCPQAIF